MRRGLPVIVVAALVGCPDPPPENHDPVPLAEADGWERVTDPAGDVFAAMRPADATCDDAGYYVDPLTQVFEVQTELCDYLTVRQAGLESLEVGDVVSIRAFHYELTAVTASQGYLGLAIDGEVVWEEGVPIPSPAAAVSGDITIERAVPAGAELQFHVHNHGLNSWDLVSLKVTPG